MLTPEEKRTWFDANQLLRDEQERIITELRAALTELEDAVVDAHPTAPAVFVAFGKLPELRNRILAERKNKAAQTYEQ